MISLTFCLGQVGWSPHTFYFDFLSTFSKDVSPLEVPIHFTPGPYILLRSRTFTIGPTPIHFPLSSYRRLLNISPYRPPHTFLLSSHTFYSGAIHFSIEKPLLITEVCGGACMHSYAQGCRLGGGEMVTSRWAFLRGRKKGSQHSVPTPRLLVLKVSLAVL